MKTMIWKYLRPLVVTLVMTLPLCAAEVPERLALPGEGHLSGVWIPETGPALVAWESTDAGWARVEHYARGAKLHEWSFDGEFVRQAQWIVPGKTLRLAVVGASGPRLRRAAGLGS